MKRQIRKNVFETNSSSTHSITMCLKSEFEKWKNDELILDRWNGKLVPVTEKETEDDDRYFTYQQWCEGDYELYEFRESYTTLNGEKIMAFGKYGYDG